MSGVTSPKRRKTDTVAGAEREACKYGVQCYQKNPRHKLLFSHPGDPDWTLAPSTSPEATASDEPAVWQDVGAPRKGIVPLCVLTSPATPPSTVILALDIDWTVIKTKRWGPLAFHFLVVLLILASVVAPSHACVGSG